MRSIRMLLLFSLFLLCGNLFSQDAEDPGAYMSQISKPQLAVAQKYISYMSAVSHGKGSRKSDKRREDLLNTINEVRMKINDLPSFQNDKSLRDATVDYFKLLYSVMNDDYAKVINMEEIAEQSYDAMEAYMLAEEKVNEKLSEAQDRRFLAEKAFAAAHNVKLLSAKDELGEKMETISRVTNYYHQVYLVFFRASKQETYLADAVTAKNLNSIEQSRSALLKYAEEGLQKLDTMKPYNGDNSIITNCRAALRFFKDEAGDKTDVVTDYLIKSEEFQKLKKAMDEKPNNERTKEVVNNFNKSVNEINKSAEHYNKVNKDLNTKRDEVYNNWNNGVKTFFDTQMPYAN